jgi:hypothetical protein
LAAPRGRARRPGERSRRVNQNGDQGECLSQSNHGSLSVRSLYISRGTSPACSAPRRGSHWGVGDGLAASFLWARAAADVSGSSQTNLWRKRTNPRTGLERLTA